MDLDLIGRGLVDLDLIGPVLIGLGAVLVCIGAFFMFRSRAPGTQVEKDAETVDKAPRTPTRHDNRNPAHQSIGK
jgi:hypothetical protein